MSGYVSPNIDWNQVAFFSLLVEITNQGTRIVNNGFSKESDDFLLSFEKMTRCDGFRKNTRAFLMENVCIYFKRNVKQVNNAVLLTGTSYQFKNFPRGKPIRGALWREIAATWRRVERNCDRWPCWLINIVFRTWKFWYSSRSWLCAHFIIIEVVRQYKLAYN